MDYPQHQQPVYISGDEGQDFIVCRRRGSLGDPPQDYYQQLDKIITNQNDQSGDRQVDPIFYGKT